jgi:hypothetical protein
MNALKRLILILFVASSTLMFVPACSSGGSPRVSYSVGVGYGGYYGYGPYHRYPGRPIFIGGGGRPELPEFPEPPVATPLPSFGMPEPSIGAMDLGAFDF